MRGAVDAMRVRRECEIGQVPRVPLESANELSAVGIKDSHNEVVARRSKETGVARELELGDGCACYDRFEKSVALELPPEGGGGEA